MCIMINSYSTGLNILTEPSLPTLYSFRRCPYAMRGRMGIAISETPVMLRELILRDKPQEMLDASPKGTVPVVIDGDTDN